MVNLTEWMLKHLPAEVVDECAYYGFGGHMSALLAEAWAKGFQDAADNTPTGYAPSGPDDKHNPFVR